MSDLWQPGEPLRFSQLRSFGTLSPAHFRYGCESDETTSMEAGTALHAMALGTAPVVAYEAGPRRGKAWEAFRDAQPENTIILSPAVFERVEEMCEALENNKFFEKARYEARKSGGIERKILWNYAGLPCRSTPDLYAPGWVADIKTSRTAKPEWFSHMAIKAAYPAQLDFYAEALRSAKLADPQHHYIFCVENTAPHVVTTFRLTDRCLDAARRLWVSWIERLRVHLESGTWPGYSDAIVDLDAPDDRSLIVFGGDEGGEDGDGAEREEAA